MAEKPRLKLPAEAKKGEVIEIKTLLPHVMESGQRKDKDGLTGSDARLQFSFRYSFSSKDFFH